MTAFNDFLSNRGWFWLLPLLFWFAEPTKARQWQPYTLTETQLYSSSMSLTNIEDWRGRYQSNGNIAIAKGWLEFGVKTSDTWRHGLVYRFQKSYHYSPATSELYFQIKNRKLLTKDKHYSLKLQLSEFRAYGFRLAKNITYIDKHSLETGISILKSDRLMYGDIQGFANILTQSSYNYSAQINYQYYRDTLFDRTGFIKPKGRGYAIDFKFLGKINPHLHYQLSIKDAFGRLYWYQAPHTIGHLQPVKTFIDAEGYFHAEAALNGTEGYKTIYQKLKPSWIGSLNYTKNKYALKIGAQSLRNKSQIGLGMSVPISSWGGDGSLFYWGKTKELVVSINKKPLKVYVGANSVRSHHINALRLGFNYAY